MKKVYLLLLLIGHTYFLSAQQLDSISPNTGTLGQTLNATISGTATVFTQGSPPQGYLQQGATRIDIGTFNNWTFMYDLTSISDIQATGDITIPLGAPTGFYDLYLDQITDPWSGNGYNLILPNAFYIGTPDGYTVCNIFLDANQNGVRDAGENGLASQSVSVNGYTLSSNGTGYLSLPLSNGTYPLYFNGNYNDRYLTLSGQILDTLSTTIANANDTVLIPLKPGLLSIYPDSAYLSQSPTIIVNSNGVFGLGSVLTGANTRLQKSGYNISSTVYTNIDANTATLEFNIPNQSAYIGQYSLRVLVNGIGYFYLNNCFNAVIPPVVLSGTVFLDIDSNGVQGIGEPGIPNKRVLLTPDSVYGFTNATGYYEIGTFGGTFTLTWQPEIGLSIAPNNVPSYTLTTSISVNNLNFGLESPNPVYTADIHILNETARCALPNYFGTYFYNYGVVPISGYTVMTIDSNMILLSNCYYGAPDSIAGNNLFWFFNNVNPYAYVTERACFSTPVAGTTINYSAAIVVLDALGNIVYSDTATKSQVVTCSYDPNDKAAEPEGEQAQHYTLFGTDIEYFIRFQNTGNDTAFNVFIRDTIDPSFDLTTFQVLNSSHGMTTELDVNTRIAKFRFDNILLPDSNVDEPGSNGWLRYKISHLPGLAENTIVYNTAGIYFDFNPAVITNTTFNTLVSVIPVSVSEQIIENNGSVVIPNPWSGQALIKLTDASKEDYVIYVYDARGKLLLTSSMNNGEYTIERKNLSSGIYFYSIRNNNKSFKGKFVIE